GATLARTVARPAHPPAGRATAPDARPVLRATHAGPAPERSGPEGGVAPVAAGAVRAATSRGSRARPTHGRTPIQRSDLASRAGRGSRRRFAPPHRRGCALRPGRRGPHR